MEFTKELIEKAKACQTAEELLALAKESGHDLSPEDAALFLQDFAEGEVPDKELDNVAGGAEGCKPPNPYENVYWDKEEDVQFVFNVGDLVEAFAAACEHHTATCRLPTGGQISSVFIPALLLPEGADGYAMLMNTIWKSSRA